MAASPACERRVTLAVSWESRMVISDREDSLVTALTRMSDSRMARADASRDSSSIRPEYTSLLCARLSISPDRDSCSVSAWAIASRLPRISACRAVMSSSMRLSPSADRRISSSMRAAFSLLW